LLDETSFRGARLCVVGNVNRDLKTAPLAAGERLFADGETAVGGFEETIGGGGANSAAMAAALGAECHFLGQTGDDALGHRLEQALAHAKVRCHLRRAPGLATGTTVNLVFDSGQRHFLSCHPNNEALAFEHLDLAPLRGGGHLLRADVWFSEPMLFGGNRRLFEAARAVDCAVSLDLNWDPLWGRAPAADIARRKQAVRDVLSLVDLAHGNARELCEFADATGLPEALRRLEGWGTRAVALHLGAQGAGFYEAGQLVTEPAHPVSRRVAFTGTGDLLSVCLMLLHHRRDVPMREKLRLANRLVAEFIEGRRRPIPVL
jgi:sugar/nucleoside kinase (ribokinase family)